MKDFPPIPQIADAPADLFEDGHLWILEKIDGASLRFQLQESGLIRFGDRGRVYDDPDDVPEAYQHAVRHVRETLDRDALRRAVADVEDVVFFGEATHRQTIDYDWERTPSFLGVDVWSAEAEAFRPPDAARQIFERLGLHPVNAFERERHARDFDASSYRIPESEWYDGPAAGVIIRDKRGQRAKLLHPDLRERDETPSASDPVSADVSADDLTAEYATQRRFEAIAERLTQREQPVTFDAVYERVLEAILREAPERHRQEVIGTEAFRSEVAALTREFLDERRVGPD